MRMRTLRRVALLGLLLVAATAAACASGDAARQQRNAAQEALATREGGIQAPTPPADATAVATAAAAPAGGGGASSTVGLTLKEWGIAAAPAQADAGTISFDAKNTGVIPHEVVLVKTDTAADKLAQKGGTVDEAKVQVIGRTDQFGGGESKTLTANVAPGKYVLICNVVGHYQLGMRTAFTVK